MMKWTQIEIKAGKAPEKVQTCALCMKLLDDWAFQPADLEELKGLLQETDSELSLKLPDNGDPQGFRICEDCKCKVDKALRSDHVHIMYTE
jgi:hypothetical protein